MDESTVILRWAMSSLDQVSPQQTAADAYQIGHFEGQRRVQGTNSTTMQSMATMAHDALSPNSILLQNPDSMSWDSFGRSSQSNKDMGFLISYGSEQTYEALDKRQGSKMARPGLMPSHAPADHIIAERKRRQKLNQRFIELSAIIPGLTKMDKASILGDAVRYVKELKERAKSLEVQKPTTTTIESVILSNDSIVSHSNASSEMYMHPLRKPLLEIEAKISEKNILVRIHCENIKGVLVKVLSEIEEVGLTVTSTNLMPFSDHSTMITVTAEIDAEFSWTTKDLVSKLNLALHQFMLRH
ncbi:transcription factor bHLH25-like isoform X1 [Typha angustifolia]|uniref:transcription factor bHLH25-like isoform X1 n=1 Tax=Typha angustifolia TaxID=59011 RepID=UPI003C2D93B8